MDQYNEEEKINGILNNMNLIIEEDNLDDFKENITALHGVLNKDLLNTCYINRGIDLICLICKHNKRKLLRYLLHESQILKYFTYENRRIETKCREDAFYYGMSVNHFEIIEMLYNHWTGDLHWLGHKKKYNHVDIENLNQINFSLKTALKRYEKWMLSKIYTERKINQNMLFNVQSLIAFSEFQRDLYKKLNKVKENLTTLEDIPEVIRLRETCIIRDMIVDMIDCYEEYINKPESIMQDSVYDIPNSIYNEFFECPKDTSLILRKAFLYVFFDVYFRKLDYNICLIILDNLHSLKLRLVMPKDAYQKLENKVYHFIYHVSNKWSLYVPKRKHIITKIYPGKHNNIDCFFTFKYNRNTFERGFYIMYLERQDFEAVIQEFKKELQERNVKENIRKDKTKLPNEEVNSLTMLPELRDSYSLKRINQYIGQFCSTDINYTREYRFLCIERTLQVVGEFLKSTNETLHLHPTTESLVKVELSVEVVNNLKTLRDLLCHVKNGELLKRIEVETNDNNTSNQILNELKFINKKIDEVIQIYKPIVEKTLILNGFSLIENRKKGMPYDVANDFFIVANRVRSFPKHKPYFELLEVPKGYAEEYSAEVILSIEHSIHMEKKLSLVTENIRNNLTKKKTIYKESIQNSLQKVIELKKNWQQIVLFLKDNQIIPLEINLLHYPNENDANSIKAYLKKADLKDDTFLCFVEDNTLFSYAENHWKFIKNLLEFIILKTKIIFFKPEDLVTVIRELNSLSDGYKNNEMEIIVSNYLAVIEEKLDTISNIKCRKQCPEFTGIQKLMHKLAMANFLTHEEKKYLTDTLNNVRDENNTVHYMKIDNMINNINKDVAVPKREFISFTDSLKLNKNAQKHLINLVIGYKRDPLHPSCLSKRIALLKDITKNQSIHELVMRYKLDKTFRSVLEVLLFDIFAILELTKDNEIVKKSSKLLTEINMRNILIHGSPLLEIVGNVLDSNDLVKELITKAIELLEEERSINALCALKNLEFDFTQISSNTLNPELQILINEFKSSARWKYYVAFIPKLKRTINKSNTTDELLLKAVINKDSILVQKMIVEGGNVNLVDGSKRGLVHHAAIKRSVDVMTVLLNNGADVNMRAMYNMTALHYSAMNGFIEVVDFLIKNGADKLALDDRGRTPVYLAGQRKHVNVCQMILRAMKN